jgi:hypothetical protein
VRRGLRRPRPLSLSRGRGGGGSVIAFNGGVGAWTGGFTPHSPASQPASSTAHVPATTPQYFAEKRRPRGRRERERARNTLRAARCRNDGRLARTTEVEKTWGGGGGGRNQFASSPRACSDLSRCSVSTTTLLLPHHYGLLFPSSIGPLCFSDGPQNCLLASGLTFCCAVGSDSQTAVRA